jgi:hypothetical protein
MCQGMGKTSPYQGLHIAYSVPCSSHGHDWNNVPQMRWNENTETVVVSHKLANVLPYTGDTPASSQNTVKKNEVPVGVE